MTRKKVYLIALLILFLPGALFAERSRWDWSDLDEGERKYYGSEKEKKFPIDAFIVEKEEWENHYSFMAFWLFRYTDYPKYQSRRFFPFWYSRKSNIDNREETFFPLYYNRIDGDTDILITPLYYSDDTKNEKDRSILYLFWWGRSTGEYDRSYIFSLIFYRSEKRWDSDESSITWFFPLFYSDFSRILFSKNTFTIRRNLSLLHYYSSVNSDEDDIEDDISETTWWAPIIPLTYHHISPEGGHRNILWILLDYSWTREDNSEKMKRFWLVPPLLCAWKGGPDGYLWITPLYVESRNSPGDNYRHLLPLFITWRSIEYRYFKKDCKWENAYCDNLITPLYCSFEIYRNSTWSGEPFEQTRWWGVMLPLLYYHRNNEGMHRNVFWLYDTFADAKGEVARRWFIPFYFWKKDSYHHVMPPFYLSWHDREEETVSFMGPLYYRRAAAGSSTKLVFLYYTYENWEYGERSFHIFPLYYTWDDEYFDGHRESTLILPLWYSLDERNSSSRERLIVNPLWMHWSEKSISGEGEADRERRLWIPLIPILYSSHISSEGAHRTFLLFDWKTDASGEWTRFWLVPLVFHEYGDSGYRCYIPFYFRPGGWTGERGFSFGIFPVQYHRWSPESETEWSWLIHYKRIDPEKKVDVYHWIPFYFSWKYRKWGAELVFPLYFEYESRRSSLSINILGLSKSVASGPNPNVSLGIGKGKEGWYLDTEVSWLYDVVSLSTRDTLRFPWEKREYEEENAADMLEEKSAENDSGVIVKDGEPGAGKDEDSGVSIHEKKGFSREESVTFWEFKILFGLFDIAESDSKNHFRLLPLCWITWDEKSQDEITWIINYFSYKSGGEEYLVFFPIYGRQVIGESYKKGYLLIAYWNEYDAEEDLREQTVLWPFVNWYSSPERSGWRFFPLIWHKEWKEEGVHTSRTISILYYGKERTGIEDGKTIYDFSISPIHYYREETKEDRFENTSFYPIIPLYYSSEERRTSRPEIPPLPLKENPEQPDDEQPPLPLSGIEMPPAEEHSITERSSYLFPLYYWTETEKSEEGKGEKIKDFTLYGLPLLYYNKQEGEKEERTFFLLGYYSHKSKELDKTSFLFGLYEGSEHPEAGSSQFKLLYGLFRVSGTDEMSESRFIPFYYYHRSPERWEFSILFGFYRDREFSSGDSDFRLLYGLFYTSREHHRRFRYVDAVETPYETEERTWWLIPLYYYSGESSTEKDYDDTVTTHLCLLWYSHRESSESEQEYDATLWVPVIPLFYRNVTEDSSHYNVLGFIDVKNDSEEQYSRTWVFPVVLTGREGDEGYRYIFPLFYRSWEKDSESKLDIIWWRSRNNATSEESNHIIPFYFSWKSPEETNIFVLGLYLHDSASYQRQNFLYLFDHQEYPEREYDRYGLIFGIFDYQVSPEIKQFRLFYNILMGYTDYRRSDDYDFHLLWILASWRRQGDIYQNSILPFWYYKTDGEEWYLLSPITLTYLSKDRTGDFDLGVLGFLYYRNNDIPGQYDRRMWLLGTLWNEVHRPERGYKSIGMFWGLLWEYETESETKYKELSILKFLYKRVELDGDVYYRILGIKF